MIQACDVLLVLYQSRDELRVVMTYRKSTMLTMHASSILQQLEDLTVKLCQRTTQTVRDLWATSGCDRWRMQRWNALGSVETADLLMHEIIHQQALEMPHKPALESWDGTLTYFQLDSLSSRLASHLIYSGVGPNIFVPISFQKSVWAIVAMLAVNKCGAAFVPVDPKVPSDRLSSILRQTNARVALACNEQAGILHDAGISVITVGDKHEHEWCDRVGSNSIYPGRDSPAYCLFTSGSTGEPKGCVMGHAAFAKIASHCSPLYLQSDSRVLQFASLGFGMALIEVFCTLSRGATLCIPSDTGRMNSLTKAISDMDVDWVVLSPTTLSTISPTDLGCLKTIVLGGEPVQESHILDWGRRARLIQIYGLTECAGIFAASDPIFCDPSQRTVGYPVNGRCWIVDPQDHKQLRGVGAVGELLIDTSNLAQGYLNDPQRTALSFVSPPSWIEHQVPARQNRPTVLYKTGDLARFNPDGSISHMGRKDHQVKVRGQRVESSEIEHRIRELFSRVADIVVDVVIPKKSNHVSSLAAFILQPDGPAEDDRLFAYASEAFLAEVQSVKLSLAKIFPGYMVPTLFLQLKKMPKTISGKKDRRRLRQEVAQMTWDQMKAYTMVQDGSRNDPAILESNAERTLAQIWATLLHLDPNQLGPDDDFLALGGDSIVAMRVVAMARVKGLNLTVADIFTTPNLREMARSARVLNNAPVTQRKLIRLVDDEVHTACLSYLREHTSLLDSCSETPLILPASDIQEFFIDRSCFDWFAYILEGSLDLGRLQAACDMVVKKHSMLRTFFTQKDHRILQVTLPHMETSLHHITTARKVSAVAEKLWSHSSFESLPMDVLPVRFILISNTEANEHALILRLSHAQYDGLSLPILTEDLAVAYGEGALSFGLQFSDYLQCRAQQDNTTGYTFWRTYLEGSTMTNLQDCTFDTKDRTKEQGTLEAVDAKALITSPCEPPEGITMATLIKAAGALVLGQLTHKKEIVFGQTVSGRSGLPLPGIESILGACLNFTPIRIDIQPTWPTAYYLRHVQAQHIQTTPHDYLALDDIVENCTSWRPQTALGAIFHHQDLDTKMAISLPGLSNPRTLHHITGSYMHQLMRSEVWVFSMAGKDGLEISIRAPAHVLQIAEADELARKIAAAVQLMARQPDSTLADIMPA
jgi:amino acid adenylation domain-containing protein